MNNGNNAKIYKNIVNMIFGIKRVCVTLHY